MRIGRFVGSGVLRGAQLAVTVLLVLAFAALLPAGPAQAGTRGGGGGGIPSDAKVEVVNRCVLYANASRFGADCAGGSSGKTIKQILGPEKFPECRYEPLLDQDLTPGDQHVGEEGEWYLVTCLEGIKPDGTGDFTRTTEVVWVPRGEEVVELTWRQDQAWGRFELAYPAPEPQFGPATVPRVLIPTFFWLTDDSGSTITRVVWDGTRDVTMRARVEQIEVQPGRDDNEQPLVCPGRGVPYDHSRGIYAQGSNCVVEYDRSSASKPEDVYLITLQANWVVEYQRADGSWRQLGMFPMENVRRTPVNEIQTVVG